MDLPTIIYFTVFHTIGDLNSIRNESIKTNSFEIRGSKIPFSLFLSWHLMLLEKRYIKNSRFWFDLPSLDIFHPLSEFHTRTAIGKIAGGKCGALTTWRGKVEIASTILANFRSITGVLSATRTPKRRRIKERNFKKKGGRETILFF